MDLLFCIESMRGANTVFIFVLLIDSMQNNRKKKKHSAGFESKKMHQESNLTTKSQLFFIVHTVHITRWTTDWAQCSTVLLMPAGEKNIFKNLSPSMIQDESGALTLKDHGICLSRYALFYQGRNRVKKKIFKRNTTAKKYRDECQCWSTRSMWIQLRDSGSFLTDKRATDTGNKYFLNALTWAALNHFF